MLVAFFIFNFIQNEMNYLLRHTFFSMILFFSLSNSNWIFDFIPSETRRGDFTKWRRKCHFILSLSFVCPQNDIEWNKIRKKRKMQYISHVSHHLLSFSMCNMTLHNWDEMSPWSNYHIHASLFRDIQMLNFWMNAVSLFRLCALDVIFKNARHMMWSFSLSLSFWVDEFWLVDYYYWLIMQHEKK